MTKEEKLNALIENGTKRFFKCIMDNLVGKNRVVFNTYHISFLFDEMKLRKLLEEQGITMNYASSYCNDSGSYTSLNYMPLDQIVFARDMKKSRVRM